LKCLPAKMAQSYRLFITPPDRCTVLKVTRLIAYRLSGTQQADTYYLAPFLPLMCHQYLNTREMLHSYFVSIYDALLIRGQKPTNIDVDAYAHISRLCSVLDTRELSLGHFSPRFKIYNFASKCRSCALDHKSPLSSTYEFP